MDERGSNRSRNTGGALALFGAAWLASLAILAAHGLPIEEPLLFLAIFGLAIPGVALLVCRGLPRIPPPAAAGADRPLLAGLVLFVSLFLAVKGPLLAALTGPAPDPRFRDTVNALAKLAAFVGIPLAAYARWGRLSPRDFGLAWPPAGQRGRGFLAFGAVGAALAGVQLVFGRGARPLLDGSLAHRHWVIGLFLCVLWMSIEAGVVEEVFFRAILQSRIAALARSNAAGILLSALVFGLAHAPGLWLRGAGTIEGLGGAPPLAVSIAYAVTTMGVAGIVFGVLWARTRNWLLVAALHGLGDALANTPAFMNTWRL